MWKKFRVAVLLFVLVNVALTTWLAKARTTSWEKPLHVVLYAINGDGSERSQTYIDDLVALDDEELTTWFADIESFFADEAARYALPLAAPVSMAFAGEAPTRPPQPPRDGSVFAIMLWSLQLRWWAWRNDDYPYLQDVEIFVLYFDPDENPTLAHSLGLQKGLIGVVNAFASKTMRRNNHLVVAHELLHTVGATDKYDPATNLPRFPEGYAEPARVPRYPQDKAEIMAGRIAVSATAAEQARRLSDTVIGEATAREINWISASP